VRRAPGACALPVCVHTEYRPIPERALTARRVAEDGQAETWEMNTSQVRQIFIFSSQDF
jgi:hypothetical protein